MEENRSDLKRLFLAIFALYAFFNIFLLLTSAHRFPFFTRNYIENNVTLQTTGFGNRIVRCVLAQSNISTKTCKDEDYTARRFVEFGIYVRVIPLVLFLFMFCLIFNDSIHRRVHHKLRWMVITFLTLLLVGDIIQLSGYMFYGIYLGSVFDFSAGDLEPAYIVGLTNILFCVLLEWTYFGVKTVGTLRKRRQGIEVYLNRVLCWPFNECFLKHPDHLEMNPPNFRQFTYNNVTVQEWLDRSNRFIAQDSITEVVKLFSQLHKVDVEMNEFGKPTTKTTLNILRVEEIGNHKVLETYKAQREIFVNQREITRQTILPLEAFRKGMKPIETANWIERVLPEDSFLKQAVDRSINEFYLFCHILPEQVEVLKDGDLDLSEFRLSVVGQEVFFSEDSVHPKFLPEPRRSTLDRDGNTVVLARVLLGKYNIRTSERLESILYTSTGTTFDTVVNEIGTTRYFGVKSLKQIYPEFAITYTKTVESVN